MGIPTLVLSAVKPEIAELLTLLERRHAIEVGPFSATTGVMKQAPEGGLAVCATGPGMVNAAMGAALLIRDLRPEQVILLGCAGSFDLEIVPIGNVALATREIDLHLGLETKGPIPSPLPFAIPGCTETPGIIDLDPELLGHAKARLKASGISFASGPFVTVSTVTTTDETANTIQKAHHALMESMEGAAVAQVCARMETPMLEIRGASNRVGRRERDTWDLPAAFASATRALLAIL